MGMLYVVEVVSSRLVRHLIFSAYLPASSFGLSSPIGGLMSLIPLQVVLLFHVVYYGLAPFSFAMEESINTVL